MESYNNNESGFGLWLNNLLRLGSPKQNDGGLVDNLNNELNQIQNIGETCLWFDGRWSKCGKGPENAFVGNKLSQVGRVEQTISMHHSIIID